MALSFIGKPISLISHSDVRYRGILAGIDPVASTIQLSNVYSMGTETRRPPTEFIPPVQEPYQYIIFRASEVKDLAVDEPTPSRSVHDDPAVLGASAPMTAAYPPYGTPPQSVAPPPSGPQPPQQQLPPQQQYNRPPHPLQASPAPPQPVPGQQIYSQQQQQQQALASTQAAPPQQQPRQQPGQAGQSNNTNSNNRRNNNSIQSAAVSLETVERAIGDLRVSTNVTGTAPSGGRGGRRGGRGPHRGGGDHTHTTNGQELLHVPTTDFDFQSSNAKFDKAALAASSKANSVINGDEDGSEPDTSGQGAEGESQAEKKDKSSPVAYNPTKSFFDSLSSSAHPSADASTAGTSTGNGGAGGNGGRGRRGRGGGAAARSRREEERERNVATFGEPGGIGLMGPGAYVGGWGGYGGHGGRRGGRPRRGGAAVVPTRG
ncbi:hypothetical protein M378DRAFT_185798 [Amanita muscaria Koide BX008]|uniref:Uncharacterized protein n=1 Tax=Amanita muscaria (strain Koide BX008) TaxID=946122 RepID=A0A0C2WYY1_AMAMK|nr:hypothetical protein M378DRAFT_185798 [Amanita muscaria Koide BX008]